jgi:metal-responsive CopG/Arc/MetJ family transcriptional regulator
MKISISVPDDTAFEVDDLAKLLGVSRSHVYAVAANNYVGRHSERRAKLDVVYGAPTSLPPSPFRRQAAKNLRKSRGGHFW